VSPEEIAAWTGAGVGVLALIGAGWRAARAAARVVGRVDDLVDDWKGTPARSGVPARPGLMARVAAIEEQTAQIADRVTAIEHELHPNSGASLRDAVDRVDRRTARLSPEG